MSRCISKLCEFNGCRFPQACPIASFGDITEAIAPAPDAPAAREEEDPKTLRVSLDWAIQEADKAFTRVAELEAVIRDISEATVTHDPEPFRNRVIAILARVPVEGER